MRTAAAPQRTCGTNKTISTTIRSYLKTTDIRIVHNRDRPTRSQYHLYDPYNSQQSDRKYIGPPWRAASFKSLYLNHPHAAVPLPAVQRG